MNRKKRSAIRPWESTRSERRIRPIVRRGLPSLEDEQAREIARMAIALEAHVGVPVDIECAFAQGTLYLLQCRPITTLG